MPAERFAHLRALLSRAPDVALWLELRACLSHWPAAQQREVAYAYAQEHLAHWEDRQRVALLSDFQPEMFARPAGGLWQFNRALCLSLASLEEDELGCLLATPALEHVRVLCCSNAPASPGMLRTIVKAPIAPQLHTLSLLALSLDDASFGILAEAQHFGGLRALELNKTNLTSQGLRRLSGCHAWPSLRKLAIDLRSREDWSALREGPLLGQLDELALHLSCHEPGLDFLAEEPPPASLPLTLCLADCYSLAHQLPTLDRLVPLLPSLQTIDLRWDPLRYAARVREEEKAAIARYPSLQSLAWRHHPTLSARTFHTGMFINIPWAVSAVSPEEVQSKSSASSPVPLPVEVLAQPGFVEATLKTAVPADGRSFFMLPSTEKLSIGRSSQNHFRLDHDSVSRFHACIRGTDGSYTLSDMASTSGTYINDHLIRHTPLRHGDWIGLGALYLQFQTGAECDASFRQTIFRKLSTEHFFDPVSGLLNRRYFVQWLQEVLLQCQSQDHDLSLVLLNLDRFKNVNNAYGHGEGDRVLTHYMLVLLQTMEDSPHHMPIARVGGDEFAFFLCADAAKEALPLAETLREAVASSAFRLYDGDESNSANAGESGGESVSLTLSGSVTSLQAQESFASLMHRAEEALYRAKREGRNRIYEARGDADGEG